MNPILIQHKTAFQSLVGALLQPFTPVSFSPLGSPETWIQAYQAQLRREITSTGTFLVDDFYLVSSQLFPRCSSYVLGYIKTHGQITAVYNVKEKMRLWSQHGIITQFTMFQTILGTLRILLSNNGLTDNHVISALDMILRFDILFVTAKLLVVLNNDQQRHRFRSETGERAQALLDLLQSILDCHPHGSARAIILDTTFRLSRESGLVPSCLILMDLEKDVTTAVAWGGFGDIWSGKIGETRVAIKSMRHFSSRPVESTVRAFSREAVLWRQFHHPNVLPFYGVHLWPREREPCAFVCLVSPWMENGNVTEYLLRPGCKDRNSLLLDIARGVEYLHNFQPPVVHGDLKGNNILITPSGTACIADFGLCTFTQDHMFQVTDGNSTGDIGAALYCAPELLSPGSMDSNGQRAGIIPGRKTRESDVYAFGCLCYELFTGRTRFSNLSALFFAMTAISAHRPVPQPTNMNPDLWDLIQECWDRTPSARPTMSTIVRRLNLLVNDPESARNTPGCTFKWDEQLLSQLNSPWAMLKAPFGLGHDSHRNMTSVPVLLSEDDIKTIGHQDTIVALMGPSGVGKSSFINTVLGHEIATVGRTLESCTDNVRAYGCLHPDGSGRKVVMVDTPGFDDSDRTDYEVLSDIVEWLTATYKKDIVLTGILQLHSIAEARMRGTPRKNLEVFRQLCGNDALQNVSLTTTFWDKVPLDVATMREGQLKTEFWGHMIEQGCRIKRFYPPTMDTAWSLVSELDNGARRRALVVQQEIVDQGKKLHQTSAFGALYDWWKKMLDSLRGRFAKNKLPREKELKRADKELRKMTRRNSTRSSFRDYVISRAPTPGG